MDFDLQVALDNAIEEGDEERIALLFEMAAEMNNDVNIPDEIQMPEEHVYGEEEPIDEEFQIPDEFNIPEVEIVHDDIPEEKLSDEELQEGSFGSRFIENLSINKPKTNQKEEEGSPEQILYCPVG